MDPMNGMVGNEDEESKIEAFMLASALTRLGLLHLGMLVSCIVPCHINGSDQ